MSNIFCFSKLLLTRNHRNLVDNSNILKWNLIFISNAFAFFFLSKVASSRKVFSCLPYFFLHFQHLRMFHILSNFHKNWVKCEIFLRIIWKVSFFVCVIWTTSEFGIETDVLLHFVTFHTVKTTEILWQFRWN